MVKKIKFNLLVNGKSVGDFEQLQDNFSADLLDYIENQKLAKWFNVRDMDDKAQQVSEIEPIASPMVQMKSLCRILELEDDEDVIAYLLEEREKRQKELTIRQELTVSTKSSAEELDESDDTEASENNRKGEDWSGRDLSGRDFTGADLSGYNLSGANLKGTVLINANLYACNLNGANLEKAILFGANFSYSNLSKANFTFANVAYYGSPKGDRGLAKKEAEGNLLKYKKNVNFSYATMDGATLNEGFFQDANFSNVHAHEIIARESNFSLANTVNADFSFSDFTDSTITTNQFNSGKFLGVKGLEVRDRNRSIYGIW